MGIVNRLAFGLAGVGKVEDFKKELATESFTYRGIEIWSEGTKVSVLNTDNFVDDYATIVLEYYGKYTVYLDESLGIYWDSIRTGRKLFV